MQSSGDLLADRRFSYAMALRKEGDATGAADLIAQALEIAPQWAAGWLALGESYKEADQEEKAIAAFEQALALDPSDRVGAGPRLARLGARASEGALTAAHVTQLFDDYAERFDEALTGALQYRAPALMRDAVLRLADRRFARALDLGCGTGLSGAAFRDRCDVLIGVDLSSEMVQKARAKAIYESLVVDDVHSWLSREEVDSADLVLAADVLVYLGDLAPLFQSVATVLRSGGMFAFTVQRAEGGDFHLGEDLRYAHSADYLRTLALRIRLDILILEAVSTRQDGGKPVPGLLAIMGKS